MFRRRLEKRRHLSIRGFLAAAAVFSSLNYIYFFSAFGFNDCGENNDLPEVERRDLTMPAAPASIIISSNRAASSKNQLLEKRRPMLAVVVAVRPNYMKAAPILWEIERQQHRLEWDVQLVHTGQHFDKSMSDVFFEQLRMPRPTVNLNVGLSGGADSDGVDQLIKTQAKLKEHFDANRPDLVMVIGDVSSTLACAYTAWGLKIPIVHLESGLRSGDLTLPEEMNRILTDRMSTYLFVTEPSGTKHLTEEGVVRAGFVDHNRRLFYIGNPMIDTLFHALNATAAYNALEKYRVKEKEYILATFHRQDNVDTQTSLAEVLTVLRSVSKISPVILSLHPRTLARLETLKLLDELKALAPAVQYQSSLSYIDFIHLEKNAMLVLTDSGGIQEETTALNIPCITARPSTERPTTVTQGTNYVVPRQEFHKIVSLVQEAKAGQWQKAGRLPLFWDGKANVRAVEALDKIFRQGVKTVQGVALGSDFRNLGGKRILVLAADGSGDLKGGGLGGCLWIYNLIRAFLFEPNTHVDYVSSSPITPGMAHNGYLQFDMMTSLNRTTMLYPRLGEPNDAFKGLQKRFKKGKRLTDVEIGEVAQYLDSIYCYDIIVYRNMHVTKFTQFFNVLQSKEETRYMLSKVLAHSFFNTSTAVAKKSGATVAIQSPLQLTGGSRPKDMKAHLSDHHEIWLPPLIEKLSRTEPRVFPNKQPLRFCYIGTWANSALRGEEFFLNEALESICQLIHENDAGTFSFLFVFSQQPPDSFHEKAKKCPGVLVHPNKISHEEAMDNYANKCDIGIRGLSNLEESFHISTKVIEMASTGLPIFINRYPINEELLGPEYPLWWDEKSPISSFKELVKKLIEKHHIYLEASTAVLKMAQSFTFQNVAPRLRDMMDKIEPKCLPKQTN